MEPIRKFSKEQLDRYLRWGNKKVDGWLYSVDAQLIRTIGDIQTKNGISGSVGEIGVWQGRLFILLYLLLHVDEKAFSIDIFDQNHLSKDRSNPKPGSGSNVLLDGFFDNVKRHVGLPEDIQTIRASSDSVADEDILSAVGPVRLFSIDGGHTKEIVINDLDLAASTLCEQGVIIFDDCFRPEWPGVSNGLHEFFFRKAPTLVPFAISLNKVFLCKPSMATMYRESLNELEPEHYNKESTFFGSPVGFYSNRWEHKVKKKGLPRKIHKLLRGFWLYREVFMK